MQLPQWQNIRNGMKDHTLNTQLLYLHFLYAITLFTKLLKKLNYLYKKCTIPSLEKTCLEAKDSRFYPFFFFCFYYNLL